MKIKFFMGTSRGKLENEVNNFSHDKQIHNILMTEDQEGCITLMVMYEENDENA